MSDEEKIPIELEETKQPIEEAPHPPSFVEIIQMIQAGQKPDDIKEINDAAAANPTITPASLQPRPKPWELKKQQEQAAAAAASSSSSSENAETSNPVVENQAAAETASSE
eukprot:TRINITY_DN460_c0_g1_i2.p1 TRINITY_DN460_c0_g1~~TRINITY_DN460_c0_g1_i2.p1  ORF type:complete len:111 (-),score=45.01 TRINITY_DN460_c0_g1_i2:30-362(-)